MKPFLTLLTPLLLMLPFPPDDQLPTGGTIPIKRLVDSCKAQEKPSQLCIDLSNDLMQYFE